MSTFQDPHWPRASEWLGLNQRGGLAVLGVPMNASITPGRCDLAPKAIREALSRLSTYDLEHDAEVLDLPVRDLGDLSLPDRPEEALGPIADAVAEALTSAEAVVLLGGDNGLTRPALHGVMPLDDVGLITLDAHLDLRSTEGGLHNGNPVRQLLADGLPGDRIVQIGIAPFANSREYLEVARRHDLWVISAEEARAAGLAHTVRAALHRLEPMVEAIYLDLDLDVLDRAFAPACPGARPGGFAPHEVREAAFVAGTHSKVMAMDLVELDPTRDDGDRTALAAGQFLLSFAAGLVRRR